MGYFLEQLAPSRRCRRFSRLPNLRPASGHTRTLENQKGSVWETILQSGSHHWLFRL
jgi:hypothetical protein